MKSIYILPKLSVLSLALLIPASFMAQSLQANHALQHSTNNVFRDAALTEVVKAAVSVIKTNKPGAPELVVVFFDTIQKKRIKPINDEGVTLTPEEIAAQKSAAISALQESDIPAVETSLKEEFVKNLKLDQKISIFIHISEQLLHTKDKPFKTSVSLTQFDTFILIINVLLDNEPAFKNLVHGFQQCFGVKGDTWKIQARLNKHVNNTPLPAKVEDFLNKNLFTTDPRRISSIQSRIKYLTLN